MVSGSRCMVSFSRSCAIFEIINQKCILLMRQLAPASSLVLSLPSHILIKLDVILEREVCKARCFPPVAGERRSNAAILLLITFPNWLIIMIGPGGLLLVVPHLFACCPRFTFMGGVAKKEITKLGYEKYFCKITYRAPLEML